MRVVSAAGTDIGHVRDGNEDSYLVQPPLYVVADGMGGHLGGEVASRMAVETLERMAARGEGTLEDQIREANRAVHERSLRDRTVAGMGTTLTAALLEGDVGHLAHVGDSRAYLLRDGRLRQLTEDHTLVHRMLRDGELTPAEAEAHPYRSILTRVLGTDPDLEIDQIDFPLRPGDRLLLCSDGLTGMLPDLRIAEILQTEPDPNEAVSRLIREANEAGGVDNITAILLEVQPDGGPEADQGKERAAPERASAVTTDADDGGGPVERGSLPAERVPPPPPRRPLASARRLLISVSVTLAVLVLVFVGLRIYLDTQWFVGVSDDRVAVFRGIPAEVGGFDLHHVVVETTIAADDAQALALYRDLGDGITADDRAEADAIVEQIRADVAESGGAQGPAP
jgi:protein phosphatase